MKFIFLSVLLLLISSCDKPVGATPKPSALVSVKTPSAEVVSSSESKHSHEQKPHIHGAASVNIVQEGSQLIIAISLPSDDAVGFEHLPVTESEKNQLNSALRTLQTPDALFFMSSEAVCTLKQGEVETALLNPGINPGEHLDIDGKYQWDCKNPQLLKRVSMELFTHFNSLEKIQVEYSVNAKQGSANLSRNNAVVAFD